MSKKPYSQVIEAAHRVNMNVCLYGLEDCSGYNLTDLSNDLDKTGLRYKTIHANILDQYDFNVPTTEGIIETNIFDNVDIVVLNDYSKAMPIVHASIIQWVIDHKERPTFIIFERVDNYRMVPTFLMHLGFIFIDMDKD